jgi:ParB family chromosome partitioning protein
MLSDSLIKQAKNQDLDPIARAKIFKKLISKFGLTTGKLAKRLGKSPSYISNTIRLLNLPEALKDALISGTICPGHARALAAISDQKKMIVAYKQILRTDGSVRQAEALSRKVKEEILSESRQKVDKMLIKIKRNISQALDGAKVEVVQSRVQTRISVFLKGNQEKTAPWLEKIYSLLTKPSLSKGQ